MRTIPEADIVQLLDAVKSKPKRRLVAAYANDVFGYIPSKRVLKEGGYEGVTGMFEYGHRAPYTEAVENLITAKVDYLVKKAQ